MPVKDRREKVSLLAFVLFLLLVALGLARSPRRPRLCGCVCVRAPLSRLLMILLLLLLLLLLAFISAGSCGFLAVQEFISVLSTGRILSAPIIYFRSARSPWVLFSMFCLYSLSKVRVEQSAPSALFSIYSRCLYVGNSPFGCGCYR